MSASNVNAAVHNYLAAQDTVLALVEEDYICKGKLRKADLKGSGKAAIVIKASGGDPRGNSLYNPRVNIMIYADNTRNDDDEPTAEDAEDRLWAIFKVVDPLLHWNNREPRTLDGIYILGSLRGVAPQILPDDDIGLEYLWAAYDMSLST